LKFSKKYASFEDWLRNFKGSAAYRKRIVRLHELHPEATLRQLRGHPSFREKPLKRRVKIYREKWSQLTERQKYYREQSLKVLRDVRKGKSLRASAKEHNIQVSTVIKNTGAFVKRGGKWVAKDSDRIPRVMSIFEDGGKTWVEIADSHIASMIGRYNNAVKQFINTGDDSMLREFSGKRFRDVDGKEHVFLTDTGRLIEIFEGLDEGEFYTIYD